MVILLVRISVGLTSTVVIFCVKAVEMNALNEFPRSDLKSSLRISALNILATTITPRLRRYADHNPLIVDLRW